MAIQTSPLFTGFRGSVNRKILFRQCGGKTVISRFPNRSRVIYSDSQKLARRRFSDAVDFARNIVNEPALKHMYSAKACLMGFRSAWNLAIAEYMSAKPLKIKRKKIRFDKSILIRSLGWNIPVKLYKYAEETEHCDLKVPPRLRRKRCEVADKVRHDKPPLRGLRRFRLKAGGPTIIKRSLCHPVLSDKANSEPPDLFKLLLSPFNDPEGVKCL